MKNNKLLTIFFVTIICLSYRNVYAIEQDNEQTPKENIVESEKKEETSNVKKEEETVPTGLQKEENGYYYIEDGKRVIGFKEINGILYFFSSKNGLATQGWKAAYGNVWYQDEEGKVVRGLQTIEGKKYYFNEETGYQEIGFKKIGEDLYFFSSIDKSVSQGWKAAYGNVWYQDEEGKVVRGLQTIEGKKYYFNEETGYQEIGFKKIGEDLYFFSSIDKSVSQGWKAAYGNVWYQDEEGKVVRGLQTIEGKKYYFNEETGYQEIGFKNVGEDLYFFSSLDKSVSQGWKAAYGNVWYQDEEGKVVRGVRVIDNTMYCFDDETGYRTSGFKEYNGKFYFFSSKDGMVSHGWKTAYGKHWYQDETGALVTGVQNIAGRDYKFNETSGFMEGFIEKDGKLYYYNPDGTQAKGIQYMMNEFLKFNELSGAYEKNVREVRTIDVSAHQGNIDWEKVKASGKVDAVILRLGYGVGYVDTKFIRNKNELERLGIPYSVYLFSYAENKNEALMESNFLVNTLKNNNAHIASNIFSLYYDLEDWEIKSTGENSYGISKDTYGDMITTFVDNTEKNMCIKTRVYASKSYIETRFPEDKQQYATWVAQWNDTLTYQGPYEGWQYSNCENIPGISGCVDMSKFYY